MIGIIEFREDEHKRNIHLLHNIKRDICELMKNIYVNETGERRNPVYDERRGRSNMRGGGSMNYKEFNHYPMREPWEDDSMNERYDY